MEELLQDLHQWLEERLLTLTSWGDGSMILSRGDEEVKDSLFQIGKGGIHRLETE